MTGRGIDQALPQSVAPHLYEAYVTNARRYVQLAENVHGPIPAEVGYDYIWGDALEELVHFSPELRLINLETSVTTSEEQWEGKHIHYRMHPANVACLTTAGVDCCALANNHVLDWGYPGLEETLATLEKAAVAAVGAGQSLSEAREPTVFESARGNQVVVFALGLPTSGIPRAWAATESRAGVNLLAELNDEVIAGIKRELAPTRQPGAITIASIHWGSNWDYEIPRRQQQLAYRLIDEAGVDVVHGHSSHHVKGIEVYGERLILYGCGDLLTDYEGIEGYERFRGDLSLMYFPEVDAATGELRSLTMTPTQMRRFQVRRATQADSAWLAQRLNREGKRLGTQVRRDEENRLHLAWR